MSVGISEILGDKPGDSGVAPTIREYEHRFWMDKTRGSEIKPSDYKQVNDLRCDLVTDFYCRKPSRGEDGSAA